MTQPGGRMHKQHLAEAQAELRRAVLHRTEIEQELDRARGRLAAARPGSVLHPKRRQQALDDVRSLTRELRSQELEVKQHEEWVNEARFRDRAETFKQTDAIMRELRK